MRAECGTNYGAQKHRERGEKPCEPCSAAAATYMDAYRIVTGCKTSVAIPVPILHALLTGESAQILVDELGPDRVAAIAEAMARKSKRAANAA